MNIQMHLDGWWYMHNLSEKTEPVKLRWYPQIAENWCTCIYKAV